MRIATNLSQKKPRGSPSVCRRTKNGPPPPTGRLIPFAGMRTGYSLNPAWRTTPRRSENGRGGNRDRASRKFGIRDQRRCDENGGSRGPGGLQRSATQNRGVPAPRLPTVGNAPGKGEHRPHQIQFRIWNAVPCRCRVRPTNEASPLDAAARRPRHRKFGRLPVTGASQEGSHRSPKANAPAWNLKKENPQYGYLHNTNTTQKKSKKHTRDTRLAPSHQATQLTGQPRNLRRSQAKPPNRSPPIISGLTLNGSLCDNSQQQFRVNVRVTVIVRPQQHHISNQISPTGTPRELTISSPRGTPHSDPARIPRKLP